ncbi:MAG: hypothetical protein QOI26_2472 [Pseudonocardiales bacterium]|nr:hypothetical protein [Pseudonocardiales bacterium]
MHLPSVNGNSRLHFWLRVREFAVPPSMIETATVRRTVGDWAGACAAARVDVDLDLRAVARARGRGFAAWVRADLRHLAPDLLRWHMPRIAPEGLLRPGLTVSLARYGGMDLVARTPPAWADAGQRISLALWDGSVTGLRAYPHPHPDRRFRLDLHRHLWDARRAGELRERSGAAAHSPPAAALPPGGAVEVPPGCAVDRWAAEALLLLHAHGQTGGRVAVRVGARRRLVLDVAAHPSGPPALTFAAPASGDPAAPVLPDAATWVPPDLDLLRSGLLDADLLHPLVAAALVPDRPAANPLDFGASAPRFVECRGARHRIGLVAGVLAALDHDPTEIRREEMLAALGGIPLACLQAIDDAHRQPERLADVQARLDHGDAAGALAAVEAILGPDALMRCGALRDELDTAAQRQVTHGLFRAGLIGHAPPRDAQCRSRRRASRSRPRQATNR